MLDFSLTNGDIIQLIVVPLLYYWTLEGAFSEGVEIGESGDKPYDAAELEIATMNLSAISIFYKLFLTPYFGYIAISQWGMETGILVACVFLFAGGSVGWRSQKYLFKDYFFLHWLRNYKLVSIMLFIVLIYNTLSLIGYTPLVFH